MVPSTYPRADTVSGEKLPTVGKIAVTLSFNESEFPCEFHVIENITTNAVLGRDFLLKNNAIVNFADGTLKLENTQPIELFQKATDSQPMASLLKVRVQDNQPASLHKDENSAPMFA